MAESIGWREALCFFRRYVVARSTSRRAKHPAGGSARRLMRPAYGSQDTAFAAALPIGLILPRHVRMPSEVRESL